MTTITPITQETQKETFIHLNDRTFAHYKIIYRINDGYAVRDLTQIHSKHLLLFQKFSNKIQQMNLMLVDSIFPIHLADVALEVLMNNVSSFKEYILLKKKFTVLDPKRDEQYFNYKFKTFIHHLLFSNIASHEVCKGIVKHDKVYTLNYQFDEMEYFSPLGISKLIDGVLDKMKLKIDFNQSKILKEEVELKLRIFID